MRVGPARWRDGDADEQEREKIEGMAQKTSGRGLSMMVSHLMRIWQQLIVPGSWEGLMRCAAL